MENAKILVYDGSFNGFLTTVFRAFDEQIKLADIQKKAIAQRGLFSDTEIVTTQIEHAKSVWKGIQTKSHIAIRNIYFAFLSEQHGVEILLYNYIKKLFTPPAMLALNETDDLHAKINQFSKSVGKEKQFLETNLKFHTTADGVQFAFANPDNDVLPLISRHYRFQSSHSPWLIFDNKRNYGLYYNLKTVEFVSLNTDVVHSNMDLSQLNVKSVLVRKLHPQPMQKQKTGYFQNRTAV